MKRSWAFFVVQSLQNKGQPVSLKSILAEVSRAGVELSEADVQWVRGTLAPRVATRGN